MERVIESPLDDIEFDVTVGQTIWGRTNRQSQWKKLMDVPKTGTLKMSIEAIIELKPKAEGSAYPISFLVLDPGEEPPRLN